MESLPTELRHVITSWLTPFEKAVYLRTHRGARADISNCQLIHLNIWMRVFNNDKWIRKVQSNGLHPVLLGCGTKYMALVLTSDSVFDITKGTCPDILLSSLRSKALSKASLEVEFPHFTLNIVNIMEPGLAIDVPDPTHCLQNENSRVSAIYYADSSSRKHDLEPHMATSQLSVVELPCFSGQNVWVFKRRYTEPGARERGLSRALPNKSKRVTSTRKSLRPLRKAPTRPTRPEENSADVWEP
jgi:hypothetical protein